MSYVWENIRYICIHSWEEYLHYNHPVSMFSLVLSQLMEIDIDKCKLIIAFPFGLCAAVNNKDYSLCVLYAWNACKLYTILGASCETIRPTVCHLHRPSYQHQKRFVYLCLWYIFPLFLECYNTSCMCPTHWHRFDCLCIYVCVALRFFSVCTLTHPLSFFSKTKILLLDTVKSSSLWFSNQYLIP